MVPKLSQNDPKIVPIRSENSPKMVPKLFQNCPKIVPKYSRYSLQMVPKWSQDCPKVSKMAAKGKSAKPNLLRLVLE